MGSDSQHQQPLTFSWFRIRARDTWLEWQVILESTEGIKKPHHSVSEWEISSKDDEKTKDKQDSCGLLLESTRKHDWKECKSSRLHVKQEDRWVYCCWKFGETRPVMAWTCKKQHPHLLVWYYSDAHVRGNLSQAPLPYWEERKSALMPQAL